MKNKLIKLIATVGLFVCTVSILAFYALKPLYNPEKTFFSFYNSGFTELENQRVQPRQIEGTYSDDTLKYYKSYKVVTSDFNIINPVFTIIQQSKTKDQDTTIIQLYLNRKLNLDFDVKKSVVSFIKNKSFTEAVEIAKKYDLSKENPDPENIIVQKPPTREEVQKAKREQELRDQREKNEPYLKAREQCLEDNKDEFRKYATYDIETNSYTPNTEQYLKELNAVSEKIEKCRTEVEIKFGYEKP